MEKSVWLRLGLAAALLAMPPAVLAAEQGTEQGQDKDPCRGESAEGHDARIDRLRDSVFAGVCSTSRWFDGLFGDARSHDESYDQTYGRAGVALSWDERDNLSLDGHLRANVQLPALGERYNAVIGRETEESFIADNFDDVGFLPGSFSDEQGADWYAGINYAALKGSNSRFDISGGVQVKSPLNPYVKARYRHYKYLGEDLLLTTRLTGFWENEDGLGITLAADADWSINDNLLLRWGNAATRSESTQGLRWKTGLTLYQALSERSAIRYEARLRGETGGFQPDLHGVRVTYRRSVWREWFFVETVAGVFWADDERPERRCSGCAVVGLGFELMFGERYGQTAPGSEKP